MVSPSFQRPERSNGDATQAARERPRRRGARDPGCVILPRPPCGQIAPRALQVCKTPGRRLGDRPETVSRVGIGSERVAFGGSCERRAAAGEAGVANLKTCGPSARAAPRTGLL